MDGPTDRPYYRDARMHIKIGRRAWSMDDEQDHLSFLVNECIDGIAVNCIDDSFDDKSRSFLGPVRTSSCLKIKKIVSDLEISHRCDYR